MDGMAKIEGAAYNNYTVSMDANKRAAFFQPLLKKDQETFITILLFKINIYAGGLEFSGFRLKGGESIPIDEPVENREYEYIRIFFIPNAVYR